MPDDDELIERSRAVRAQAGELMAWLEITRERSRAIVNRGIHVPFGLPGEWPEGTALLGAESEQRHHEERFGSGLAGRGRATLMDRDASITA
jgi:hypothetical protein